MNASSRVASWVLTAVVLVGLGACAGMSPRERNLVIGAGTGAVAGAALTGGSAVGTVGGAAVGGFIGNEIGRKR